ncbi:MAG: hypothetical protein H0Z39_08790 [Peptococcaceae bacterium]|nr:hypothetical protein [Peptococcaceae bacterium]
MVSKLCNALLNGLAYLFLICLALSWLGTAVVTFTKGAGALAADIAGALVLILGMVAAVQHRIAAHKTRHEDYEEVVKHMKKFRRAVWLTCLGLLFFGLIAEIVTLPSYIDVHYGS